MKHLTIPTTANVSLDRISDLLCSALEGGSNYWYEINQFVQPETLNFISDSSETPQIFKHLDYPLNEGGALVMSVPEDEDSKTYTLDLQSIEKGLKIMAEKYPRHFADFLGENDDASTGDVFLQCCLFEDVIFG